MAAGDATPPPGSRTGLIIGLVVAALAVIGVGAFFLTRDDDETITADTTPELTVPDVTATDVTVPDPTSPEVTDPDLTIPDITIPDITFPDLTIPDFSIPDFSIPDFSIPEFSIPDLSIPDLTIPGVVPGPIPPAVDPPEGLGDDATFNALAQDCYDGSMQSCDDLYDDTVDDATLTAYTVYGDTCAGRQEQGTGNYCRDTFPGE